MTDPSLESWFENWGPTSVQVERASLLRYEKSISVTSAILISKVQPCPTASGSTQPQVYINCNDRVPPLAWLHSVYMTLYDITACDEISHAFSHCICRCTVAVFEVCIQVQAGRFYHMRDINVFLGRGGVWRILVPSWWGKSPRPPSKWSKDDGKIKLMACIHLFSRWNCVHKNVLFLLIWTCASSYCHTQLLSFLYGL